MSDQRTEELSAPRVNVNIAAAPAAHGTQGEATRSGVVDIDSVAAGAKEQGRPPPKISAAKAARQGRLPDLDDDVEIGIQKECIVTRDGKPDLLFAGVLLASAAPAAAPKGHWQEYRIYRTNGDKHVFSKVGRDIREDEDDTHEAEVFDPAPSSVPSQLLRSAREIARARPLTWMDAAVAFFGYDPLAKTLYRKLSVRFEEEIT